LSFAIDRRARSDQDYDLIQVTCQSPASVKGCQSPSISASFSIPRLSHHGISDCPPGRASSLSYTPVGPRGCSLPLPGTVCFPRGFLLPSTLLAPCLAGLRSGPPTSPPPACPGHPPSPAVRFPAGLPSSRGTSTASPFDAHHVPGLPRNMKRPSQRENIRNPNEKAQEALLFFRYQACTESSPPAHAELRSPTH
jgi:hypothetical protein